jgi:hypothetical protein
MVLRYNRMEGSMDVVFKMLEDGGFVAGDRGSGMTSYAYPSSPRAKVAKRYPMLVAEDMLSSETMNFRTIPAVQEYDRKNWETLGVQNLEVKP